MTFSSWEAGTLTLPSKDAVPLRKALNAALAAENATVVAEVNRLWNAGFAALTPTKRLAISRSLDLPPELWPTGVRSVHEIPEITHRALRLFYTANGRKPTKAITDAHRLGKPLASNTIWRTIDLGITLDGRTLRYEAPEGNHAREHARSSALGVVLFEHLNAITWTRGTGGVFTGNDEYNQDSYAAGGGANYITDRFGPLGEKA